MLSRKPYLLRAMHQWIVDSRQTPHIVVNARAADVEVPAGYARDGKLVLNISYEATSGLEFGSEAVEFSARFGGVARRVRVPMAAVLAIYAQETGQGMLFEPEENPAPSGGTSAAKSGPAGKPSLKVVK